MDSPFEYTSFVSGSSFIGRNKEVLTFCNLIRERNNVLIYGSPKIGKKSIIYNSLEKLRQETFNFTLCNVNLFNIRCIEAFFIRYTNDIFASFANSPTQWNNLLKKYLPNIPYTVDTSASPQIKLKYTTKELLSISQIEELISLTDKFAADYNTRIVIYFEHFQDFLLFEDPHKIISILEKKFKNLSLTNFIISGEKKNAMDEIFKEKKYFYKFANEIEIQPIDEKIFCDYITKSFLKAGKVILPEHAEEIYRTVEGSPWYTQHLSAICFDLTKGYLNNNIISKALLNMLSLYDFHYHYTASNLSKHQLRFLKAILEDVEKFSSADILDKYKLNSSANVKRLKEALTKKEIITFDKNKEAIFTDPLFKLWFKRYFFEKD